MLVGHVLVRLCVRQTCLMSCSNIEGELRELRELCELRELRELRDVNCDAVDA